MQYFSDLQHVYHGTKAVQAMIVDALTCALLHCASDLKAAHMNIQCNLILELMLYKFEQRNNTTEATENICCVKGEGTVDHSTVTR